jgi:uncharacterized protein YdbL (DUF1318 family)
MQSPWKQLLAACGLAFAILVGVTADVWAGPLDDAKAAGLIGERPDGYVAAVQPGPPPEIAALVKEINAKRRAAYEDIAAKQNVPIDQVGAVTAEKIKRQAPAGQYFLNPDGSWTQK